MTQFWTDTHRSLILHICTYGTISDVAKLKTLCTYLDGLICNNTMLQDYYYNHLCGLIIRFLNINNKRQETIITSDVGKLAVMIRKYVCSISPVIASNPTQHLPLAKITDQCKHIYNIYKFIQQMDDIQLNYSLQIEKTINCTELAIYSKLVRYYHNPDKIILFTAYNTVNTKYLRYINKSFKYYLLPSFRVIRFQYSAERKIGVYDDLTKDIINYNNSMIRPYTLNEHFCTNILSDFKLQWFMNLIPDKYKYNYLITGGAVVTRVIEQMRIDRNSDIDLFAFAISKQQHIHCISEFTFQLIINNIPFTTTNNTKNLQTFIFPVKKDKPRELIKLQFIWSDANAALSVLNTFDLSICQIGITLNRYVYYTNAWLFNFMTRIGYYFNIAFTDTYQNHYRLLKYIRRNQTHWLIPESIFTKRFHTQFRSYHRCGYHRLFCVNFEPRNMLPYWLFCGRSLSTTRKYKRNWDSDYLLLKFIQRILIVYNNTINIHINPNYRLKQHILMIKHLLSTIVEQYMNPKSGCTCFW